MTATATPEVAASACVAAMERAWTAIRARHPDVPEVVVILGAGSEARRGLFKLGHFAAARWQVADTRRAEVLVSGEGLGRGAVDVLGTLLHEAAHGLADTRGVKDTSRQGRYHCEGARVPGMPGTARMCREASSDWSDPRYHWPSALRLICRPDREAPPGTTGPTRDLIGAWRKAPSQCCPRSGWCVPPPSYELERDDMASMPQPQCLVTVGVDSHKDVHVAAAVDQLGRILGTTQAATTLRGYGQLERWAQGLGRVQRFGIEGTGSYAAGLARWLADRGYQVVEVNRPNRQQRRRRGKSDPVDAEAAARAALAGAGVTQPKAATATVEMLRVLRVARRSAMKARTQAANQLAGLVVTAPDPLRAQLRGLGPDQLVEVAAALRPGELTSPTAATKLALRELARRHQALSAELDRLDTQLAKLAPKAAPRLLARRGVGPQTAAALLIAAGDNPGRLHSDAAFSMLCGASPLEASSGKTVRHRLNRGGDRQANNALWVIAMTRMSCDQRTKDYVARRTTEGKSKKDIIRCLKRYIAREVYRDLQTAIAT